MAPREGVLRIARGTDTPTYDADKAYRAYFALKIDYSQRLQDD